MPAKTGLLLITPSPRRHRPFVVAHYVNNMLLERIVDCPHRCADAPCDVRRHQRRARKTGPPHDLIVFRCEVHGCFFTAYPPGFVAYARRALKERPTQFDVDSFGNILKKTAEHGAVSRAHTDPKRGSWSTLGRLLQSLSRLFKLDLLTTWLSQLVAFGLSAADLTIAAQARGCRRRAAAIYTMWSKLSLDELLSLGALTGCWGTPVWASATHRARAGPSRQ